MSPSEVKAYVRYGKPDGYSVFNVCDITDDGKISVELTEQMLAVAGTAYADLIILDAAATVKVNGDDLEVSSGKIISTMNFHVDILQTPTDLSDIESSYEFNVLNEVLSEMSQFETYANQASEAASAAQEAADEAEEWSANPPYIGGNGNWWVYDTNEEAFVDSGIDASITLEIADVTMLEPTASPYVTNTGTNTDAVFHLFIPRGASGLSAYDQAVEGGYTGTETEFEDALGNFQTYASTASTAATTATTKASEAEASATAAATSATNAATSASEASTSETNARTSASTASTRATASKNYSEASGASATAAAVSEANAATSEDNAESYAASASTSATNAAASETNAAQSETNASTHASAASTSATNAATSATNAATSEANAEESAEDSEAWAVGQRDGVDVSSSDETYHNNAKYWAEQAAGTVSGVASFNGRTGYVTPQAGDYNASMISDLMGEVQGETLILKVF